MSGQNLPSAEQASIGIIRGLVVVQEPKVLVRQGKYVLKFGHLHLMSVEMAVC